MKDRPNHISPTVNEIAVPTRPQKPRDSYGQGRGAVFQPGRAPQGGFHPVWDFGPNPTDVKNSPVSKPEKGTI